jgi:hypothetical protein
MKIKKRIRALETRMTSGPVILHFGDGSTTEICGPRGFLLKLFPGIDSGDLDPVQAEQLDLICQSVASEEPGGGHMVDLLRALLHEATPVDSPQRSQ